MAVFAEVAERGSFADAARHLNRSAAAVTRAVAELEARLGVRLLNRTTRAVSVTEAGQRFLAGARRVLADLAEIEQAAIGQGSAPRGELRVTAPIVFGRRHVLPLVTEFLGAISRGERAARVARPAGRSGRGRARCRDPHRRAGRQLGDRGPRRRAAARSWSRRRPISSAAAGRRRRAISPATTSSRSPASTASSAGVSRAASERRIKPRLIVNTAEAAIDAAIAGFGITRVLSYQAVDALSDRSLVRLMRRARRRRGAGPCGLSGRPPPAAEAPRISRRAGAAAAAALRRRSPDRSTRSGIGKTA